jgi:ABC-2 type transport system permease protein
MWRILLIAEREFKAYASTASFWIALAMGPLLMVLATLALGSLGQAPADRVIGIRTDRQEVAEVAEAALGEAVALQGLRLRLAAPGEQAGSQVSIVDGKVQVTEGQPLSRLERSLLRRDLHALELETQLKATGAELPARPRTAVAPPQKPAGPPEALTRFAPVFLLWMTLVGALGMLLQSVVRERANRALEHLLASARPAEIVFGKMLGVGAVSLLVLGTWMGSGAAIAATPLGAAPNLLAGLSSPGALAYAGAIYTMAFMLYGSALVSIGAFAKDLPSAQNLSRPVFGLLLIIFFLAMGSAIGFGEQLAWLVWLPPFTPFMLLLSPEGALAPWQHAAAWALMAACTAATTVLASRSLIISPRPLWAKRHSA